MSMHTGPANEAQHGPAELWQRGRGLWQRAPVVLNAHQAEALAALLWDGELLGTRYPRCKPPRVGAMFGVKREALGQSELRRDRRTREYVTDSHGFVAEDPPFAASHTALVVAEDGRMWMISRAGICWPDPMVEIEDAERRAREGMW